MPIYNAEKYLERSLNSLINQSIGFENIEVILVNDNSTDNTKNIIEQYSEKYENIKSFHSKINHGYPGYGRNIGINNSTADYIMFIDNDDEYDENYCEVMIDTINKENSDVVCANFTIKYPNYIIKESCFSKINEYLISKYNNKVIELNSFNKLYDSEVWTKIFKRSIIINNNISFIEQGLNEDSLFLYEYYFYAKKLVYIDYYGYYWYRDNENLSKMSYKTTSEFIKSYYKILSFVNNHYNNFDYNHFYKSTIEATIIRIIYSDDKKSLLEELHQYEEKINFKGELNHKWTTFINKLILKRRYKLVMFITSILKTFKLLLDYIRNIKNKLL